MPLKIFYRLLRTILVTVLVLPLAVPSLLYILLSIPAVQTRIGQLAENELTGMLGTPVFIGHVEFLPFTRVALRDVVVCDSLRNDILRIDQLGAGISLSETVLNRRPVITYVEILDMNLALWRESPDSPLNIDPVIARLSKKDDRKERSHFDLSVNMLVLRRSTLSYDVLSAPDPEPGVFDPQHVMISDLRADLRAPRISDRLLRVDVKRMALSERSGFDLRSFSTSVRMDTSRTVIDGLYFSLENTCLKFEPVEFDSSPFSPGWNPQNLYTRIKLLPESYVSLSDISELVPSLKGLPMVLELELDAVGSLDDFSIDRLKVNGYSFDDPVGDDSPLYIELAGNFKGLRYGTDSISVDLNDIGIGIFTPELLTTVRGMEKLPSRLKERLAPVSSLGQVNVYGQGAFTNRSVDFKGTVDTSLGNLVVDAGMLRKSADSGAPMSIDGSISTSGFSLSELSPALKGLSYIEGSADVDVVVGPKQSIKGDASLSVGEIVYNGTSYTDLAAEATFIGDKVEYKASARNASADFDVTGGSDLGNDDPCTELFADIRHIDLNPFIPKGKLSHYSASGRVGVSLYGRGIDDIHGWVSADALWLMASDQDYPDLNVGDVHLSSSVTPSDSDMPYRSISLRSRPADVDLRGNYTYGGLAADLQRLAAKVFPSLVVGNESSVDGDYGINSSAGLKMEIRPDSACQRFVGLPFEIAYPVRISSDIDRLAGCATLTLNAPILKQKDKLIEKTLLSAALQGSDGSCQMSVSTLYPTKDGKMDLHLHADGRDDTLRTSVHWVIDRESEFRGDLSLNTSFDRSTDGALLTAIRINPGAIVFNDSLWNVTPAAIDIAPGQIDVRNLGAMRSGQVLAVNGTAAADSLSRIEIKLDHIDLDYVFSTLSISDAVNFGGIATGTLYGEALLSSEPVLYTPRLWVEGLAYNHCTFGNGDIRSRWDNESKTVKILADITGPKGNVSRIDGAIRPMKEELDFRFYADDAPAGFMLPFMQAFTSGVSGYVSGDAHLYGTFKDLDLAGDVRVKDLKMKLDFNNTTYTVPSDSVHITPGLIRFSKVRIEDRYGHTARLTGQVTHNYFHDPTFRFDITDAENMLVYDVSEQSATDPWYGRIFGNGSADIRGIPGKIDIKVKMFTAPRSTFTFVLSDSENSVEHDFVILRDRSDGVEVSDSVAINIDPIAAAMTRLREKASRKNSGEGAESSVYDIEINTDITPEATINLIMDPVGGDKITAHGKGHLRMKYASDGELEMYGDYTLSRGSYNFTLQDIIIKDFTILEGSSITFLGDPYAARLNIRASYSLNANLSDLDESFLEDRELTRTNVRVNAIMIVTGDMRQPDIKFDLEFPTLTADTYRKVRSIISTEEMMSRQIIYLLALNRFYTPEYMAATHGNELVSVASSTLSSRLGSMLGQLSDNWSIAPAIRSDRGDFSDVEVDVALSSQLLDNRLLFNGNLGYRDKSLNNNSFIGDFDIRYLLNRSGSIQLKAYNRYNDQNYYLKNALTTQGVGVVFKRDFDNFFTFLKRRRKE